jgi:hypothetical protein
VCCKYAPRCRLASQRKRPLAYRRQRGIVSHWCQFDVRLAATRIKPNPIDVIGLLRCRFLIHNVGMIYGYARVLTDAQVSPTSLMATDAAARFATLVGRLPPR